MKTESRKIAPSQYEKEYIPLGGFILVDKDLLPKKIGSIVMADTVQSNHSKYSGTGTIVAMSPFAELEDAATQYLWSKLKVGDHIGFSATVPLASPCPPGYDFTEEEGYITIHLKDVLAVIAETEEKKAEFIGRFHD